MKSGHRRSDQRGNERSVDDDRALMARIRHDDASAFAALVKRHQRTILNLFRRLGADAHEAEDGAQETFLRVYRYRNSYVPSAPFPAFLHTLARHAWVDAARRRRRRELPVVDLSTQAEPALASQEERFSERIDLHAALRRLPEHHRWVIVLSAQQGLGYAEISEVLDIPLGTVKSRAFHAVRRLRELLNVRVS